MTAADPLPVGKGHAEELAGEAHARVVDEHVERAVFGVDAGSQVGHGVGIGDVAVGDGYAAADRSARLGGLLAEISSMSTASNGCLARRTPGRTRRCRHPPR